MTGLASDPRGRAEAARNQADEALGGLGWAASWTTEIHSFPVPDPIRGFLVEAELIEEGSPRPRSTVTEGFTPAIIDRITPIRTLESSSAAAEDFFQDRPRVKPAEPSSFAYSCVMDLCRWLEVGVSELTDSLGIPRATYYAWQARGSKPRPSTTRQLYKVHAIVALVVDTLGERGAHGWLHLGEPSMREKILQSGDDRLGLDRISGEVSRTFATLKPQPIDRSLAARLGGDEGIAPDGPLEGW